MLKFLIPLYLTCCILPFFLRQDQDEHNKVELAENQRLLRPELQDKLCKLMLQRYMSPLNEWTITKGYSIVFSIDKDTENYDLAKKDEEYWFVLLIKGDKSKDEPIWIKFNMSLKDVTPNLEYDSLQPGSQIMETYWENKKTNLLFQLEQAFITRMHDFEFHETIIHGEAHLYKLITKDTKIENLRKTDLVY